jgi:hypothetical protein
VECVTNVGTKVPYGATMSTETIVPVLRSRSLCAHIKCIPERDHSTTSANDGELVLTVDPGLKSRSNVGEI